MMHKLLSFLKLTSSQKFLFLSALFCLPTCQLAVNIFSFSHLIRVLGLIPTQAELASVNIQSNLAYLAEVARMTKTAAKNIPLLKARCLVQALTVMCLAGSFRKECILNLGTYYDSTKGSLSAHAWINCGEQTILGHEERHMYHHIASFSSAETVL